jgi:phosphinothricin acetyltransferase
MLSIRPASEKDIHRITEIYNEAIQNTTATFDTDIKTIEDRLEWFRGHDEKHPVLVAEFEGRVIGFASLTRWSDRCAYDGTAEVSLYVDHNYRGRGTGKQLLEVLTLEGEKAGLHNLVSRITQGNLSSIHLHELFGFIHIGVMKEAGMKFGKFLDVHFMQKLLNRNAEK